MTRARSVLDRLRPRESRTVLAQLLSAHPDLIDEAEKLARSLLGEISGKRVAQELSSRLRALTRGQLEARIARHTDVGSYIESSDAAFGLMEDEVRPYLYDMQRMIDLGLEVEALELCQGIIAGLYFARQRASDGPVMGAAPDFAAEMARFALRRWLKGAKESEGDGPDGRKRPDFPERFAARQVPAWQALVESCLTEA